MKEQRGARLCLYGVMVYGWAMILALVANIVVVYPGLDGLGGRIYERIMGTGTTVGLVLHLSGLVQLSGVVQRREKMYLMLLAVALVCIVAGDIFCHFSWTVVGWGSMLAGSLLAVWGYKGLRPRERWGTTLALVAVGLNALRILIPIVSWYMQSRMATVDGMAYRGLVWALLQSCSYVLYAGAVLLLYLAWKRMARVDWLAATD